jgi:hypothetical protein
MSPIDLDRIRLRSNGTAVLKQRPVRPRQGEHFLKGPVPLPWLEHAAKLPGKSLHVGIAVWYVAGLTRSRRVTLSNIAGHRFGLDRNAKYRALEWLEGAGLVAVERKLGRAPIITILHGETPE